VTNLLDLITTPFEVVQRPHHEGNNVMSWIGFKHVMYLAEEAVLERLRSARLGFRACLETFGMVPEFVAEQGRILTAVKLDDEVRAVVTLADQTPPLLRFNVVLWVERGGKAVKAYTGKLGFAFRRDRSLGLPPSQATPAGMDNHVVDTLEGLMSAPEPTAGTPCLTWRTPVPYFYCHGNDRLKLSGYLRLLEEADSRFCAQQGIGVGTLLRESRWIPAVPSARMEILADAHLDEELVITYRVTSVTRALLYTCAMDVSVERAGRKVRVATGEIVHGYAEITSRSDWEMVSFDERVLNALAR
jgi:acyl-CoA thioesterase FadM